MSALFYAVVALGIGVAIVLVWLLIDWAWRSFDKYREMRDIRIRNSRSHWDDAKRRTL